MNNELLKKSIRNGGFCFHYPNMQVFVYNHWELDCQWIVIISEEDADKLLFLMAFALTAEDACEKAVNVFKCKRENNELRKKSIHNGR